MPIGTLVFGVVLALGHHAFNALEDGKALAHHSLNSWEDGSPVYAH